MSEPPNLSRYGLAPVPVGHVPQTVPLSPIGASAGFPSPAGDDLEDEIDPLSWMLRHPGATFWWRVEGDCLVDIGVIDGVAWEVSAGLYAKVRIGSLASIQQTCERYLDTSESVDGVSGRP